MKIILLLSILITSNAFSEDKVDCETSMPLSGQTITSLAETKCLSDDFSKGELQNLTKEKVTKKFCNKGCNNHLLGLSLSNPKLQDEKKSKYAKATMNELQKELSYISVDLMKMRSSFSLKMDPKIPRERCDFKNLKRPSCLKSSNLDIFEQEIGKIQNAMATELASILSPAPTMNDGFFKRATPNSCEIKDNEIMFAQMRFNESLLTKELIGSFKKLNIRKGVSIEDSIEELRSGDSKLLIEATNLRDITEKLSTHPLMNSMFNDPENFKAFLAQVSSDDNKTIIDKLYDSETAQNLGSEIASRCETAFETTSRILEKVYCDEKSPYVAMNQGAMALINEKEFKDLSDNDAEVSIQQHCALLNTSFENKTLTPTSFDEVLEINSKNDSSISTLPAENFKTTAYQSLIGKYSISVCSAMKDKSICKKDPKSEQCQTLSFLEESRNDKHYKKLANSSDENINSILRSLVGNGQPEKDGKVDQAGLKLLKDEGILPGGDISPIVPGARDAGTFFKTVNSGNSGTNSTPIPQTKTTQNSTTQFKSTTGTNAAVDESSDEDPSSTSKSTSSNNLEDIKKTDKKFSALSDEEQKNILNRMKPKRKAGKSDVKGFSPDAQKDSDPFFANSAEETSNESLNNRGPASASTNTATVPTAQNTSGSKSGNYAKIDPTVVKKDGSYNKALEQAKNNDRSPSGNPVEETKFALTKNESGLNEIEIKVADESILEKKTPELEKKIQEYLEKSGQSLTGAKKGEAFIVKLGKYKIKVAINDYGAYVATCAKGEAIHPEYLAFLSRYFTGIKDRVSSRLSMEKIINEESVKRN